MPQLYFLHFIGSILLCIYTGKISYYALLASSYALFIICFTNHFLVYLQFLPRQPMAYSFSFLNEARFRVTPVPGGMGEWSLLASLTELRVKKGMFYLLLSQLPYPLIMPYSHWGTIKGPEGNKGQFCSGVVEVNQCQCTSNQRRVPDPIFGMFQIQPKNSSCELLLCEKGAVFRVTQKFWHLFTKIQKSLN